MSFCTDVKNELAGIRPSECCKIPLAYGFMLFGRSFSVKRISLQTNNQKTAEAYSKIVADAFGAAVPISSGGEVRTTYKAEVVSEADRLKILAVLDYGIADNLINSDIISRDCCFQSFIRGAFLACGNINNPEKEYRAEFTVKNDRLAGEFSELLCGYGITLKKTVRGGNYALYTKESGAVEDLLTLMGAPHRTLDIMDTKIIKSVKNSSNRRSNCDSANISKTVEASIKQRTAIEYLEKCGKLETLPTELLYAAELRQNNPDATLKELCAVSGEHLTASGLNHRLSRIISIYEELKNHNVK